MRSLITALAFFLLPLCASAQTIQTQLDSLGSTPGSTLYRAVPQWTTLPGGQPGQFLTANGANQPPSWTTYALPLTGAYQVLGTVTGQGPAAPVGISAVLDGVCQNENSPVPFTGSIAYRNATGWNCLAPVANSYLMSAGQSGPPFWNPTGTPGAGSVTSIAVSVPTFMSVSPDVGHPITGAGTFALSFNSQSANAVLAGPTPSFRTLTAADIPQPLANSNIPAPTASALGGVQSATAPTNQFMNGINTSGIPTFAQPAFSNLTGTATGAQLPAPAAASLGGVLSSTAGANQFATGINTSGALTFGQPDFSNLTGAATNAQLATMPTNTIKANVTGGTAVPTDASASSIAGILPVVRYDASQALSGAQQTQARSNIGVGSGALTLGRQFITATGNFTAPTGTISTTVFKVDCVGGGAGGGPGSTNNVTGSGGSAGGRVIKYYSGLVAASTYAVTIGAGGAAGGNGSATTFAGPGVTISASGGLANTSSPASGAAVSGTGGDLNIFGAQGTNGMTGAGSWYPGGSGGSTVFGSGGAGGVAPTTANVGTAGIGYGSGGGGGSATATTSAAGGAGASGACLVEWVL